MYNAVVEGRVVDDHHNTLSDLQVTLYDKESLAELHWGFTDKSGRYEINNVPPGDYILGVNTAGPPDESRPYAATFYPAAALSKDALTLHVGQGEQLKLADIVASTDSCEIDLRVVDGSDNPVSGATLANEVIGNDHFYTLYHPTVVTEGRARLRAWGHGEMWIYADLKNASGHWQSEPTHVHLCPGQPIVMKLIGR
jgi:hypothetical protein